MKHFTIFLLAVVLVSAIWIPPADADGRDRGWHRGWRGQPSVERHDRCVGCEFFGGLLLGGVLGGVIAAPHYAPPPPVCSTQPGYWGYLPMTDPYGYTTYQRAWIPPQTFCR
jgi:hypothetical protein